jgi:hypothetical protein
MEYASRDGYQILSSLIVSSPFSEMRIQFDASAKPTRGGR